jgi:hypothetical protein
MADLLQEHQDDFSGRVRWGGQLLQFLKASSCTVSHIRQVNDYLWLLKTRVPQTISEAYGTAPELLVVAIQADEPHARDLEAARRELYRSNMRLDVDLLLVASQSQKLPDQLKNLPGRWGQWIPITVPSQESLLSLFRRYVPAHDIFDERNPVRGRQVIGRQSETRDLVSRIESSECIGIYGFRKVGKTSVVRAATDTLDPVSALLSFSMNYDRAAEAPRATVIWMDMQRRLTRRSLDSVVSVVLKAANDRLALERLRQGAGNSLSDLESCLQSAMREAHRPVCLVFDEFDYMFESQTGGTGAIPNISSLFAMLRGLSQETHQLSIVLIGRDPTPIQVPERDGFPNPMLGWTTPRWIGPLEREKAPELLRKLGKRVGLRVGAATSNLALNWTGGHPLLQRQFGSALLQVAKTESQSAETLDTDLFAEKAVTPYLERETVREICAEIVQLLKTRYTPSYALLVELAHSREADWSGAIVNAGGWSGDACLRLRSFGILGGSVEMPIVWKTVVLYIKNNSPRPVFIVARRMS